MTRLRLLALVLLLGSAPPGAQPTGDSIVVAAKAFLKTSCAAAKPSCAETTAIHDGYLAALKDADACARKACPLPDIHAIIERDRKLDAREHALPPAARASGETRPLLRLSLLVIGRSAAALALADPKAEAPPYWNPDVEAPKMVELICVKYADLCQGARDLLQEANDLHADADACEKKACPYPVQEEMAISAERASGDYIALSTKVDTYTLPIFSVIGGALERIGKLLALTTASKLAELEKGEGEILAGVAALEKNPGAASSAKIDALNARGAELIGLYRDASNASDRNQIMLINDAGNIRMREKINAAAGRLASARARLMALKASRGLEGRSGTDGVAVGIIRPALVSSSAGKLGLILVGGAESPANASRPIPIDRRSIPKPPPSDPSAPDIIDGDPGPLDLLRGVRSKDPLVKADAVRRLGLTKTLGDPSGRAAHVHTQNAPDTCAIVAQQGVLKSLGLLPLGDPAKLEAQLAAEAKSRGFYRNGTPNAYTANLLVDRGVIVTKQNNVPLATLDAAVRRGGMIIANVDARPLWGDKAPRALGHAIVITGAEVSRLNDRTLGYYINDSGSLVLGAGRFIPIEQFNLAWENHTKTFAEIH